MTSLVGQTGSHSRLSVFGAPRFGGYCLELPRFLGRAICLSGIASNLLISGAQPLEAQVDLLPVFHFQRLAVPPDGPHGRIIRDAAGFVWIGRSYGLETYDGYSAKHYGHVENDPFSLAAGTVWSLLSDSKQRIWVGTSASCLSLYDRSRDRFLNFPIPASDSYSNRKGSIYAILESRSGMLWLATAFGIVRVEIPADTGPGNLDSLVRAIRFTEFPPGTPRNRVFDLCERKDGRIVAASDSGLLIFDPLTHVFTRPDFTDRIGRRLNSVVVSSLVQDPAGDLWLGTKTEGVFHVAWGSGKVLNFRHEEGDSLSISYDGIADLTLDPKGNLWIGTVMGIDLFSPVTGRRIPYLTFDQGPGGNYSVGLSVDYTGTLWVSTRESAYWLSPRSQLLPWYSLLDDAGRMELFMTIERDHEERLWLSSVVSDFVTAVDIHAFRVLKRMKIYPGGIVEPPYTIHQNWTLIDRRGTYWTAAQSLGLYELNLSTGHVMAYDFMPASSSRSHYVASIARGLGDSIWVAAREDGLMVFDTRTKKFSRVLPVKGYVVNVMQDREGLVWLAAADDGVLLFDPTTGTTTRFVHVASDPRCLSEGSVQSIIQDSLGRIWVGAGNSVNLWNSATRSFTRYLNPTFAASSGCLPMRADRAGRLWIAYPASWAISILDPTTGNFTDLDSSRGFWEGIPVDMETLPDGKIVLAGAYGISVFDPDSVDIRRPPPQLVITRMAINDIVGIAPSFLKGSARLLLSHTQNMLEFEFAAIDIDAPRLVQYRYQLEGLEEDWLRPRDGRYVRYTGLPPGEYVFRVRASTSYGEWPEQEIVLAIGIAPPWWRTWWAYAAYALVLIGSLYAGYRQRLMQVRLKQQADMEHFQAEHLAEVDRLKSRFFSSVSHEFRTPLTLILGPADQGIEASVDQATRQRFALIRDNARKLHTLVTQLLDFSRLESGMMRLKVSSGNIVQFLRLVVMSFESWAERKKISLEFASEAMPVQTFFDGDKLEKIVNNLMSNALKSTGEGGTVVVKVGVSPSSTHPFAGEREGEGGEESKRLIITISDSGTGIAPKHLPHIFDRFYRVDETHASEGTGIGLALTKELIELHHGMISVESTPGKGSVFTIDLPIDQEAYKPDELSETVVGPEKLEPIEFTATSAESKTAPAASADEGKRIILIVEDNADLRGYIREYLEKDYAVQEAGNGKQALDRAFEIVPDLVVSDVMMPEMDGMELCRALKRDMRTNHVPVILLTARAGTDSKIEGLEIGADDYVTKPFDAKELLARVRNLIEQRQKLREKFGRGVELKPGEVTVSSLDDEFLRRVMAAVERDMGREDFGVENLAHEVFLSRVQLYRKLQALTNMTPTEFIKRMRLQRARELLEKNAGTVAEIADSVGFSNHSYFAHCFQKQFGTLPGELRRGNTSLS